MTVKELKEALESYDDELRNKLMKYKIVIEPFQEIIGKVFTLLDGHGVEVVSDFVCSKSEERVLGTNDDLPDDLVEKIESVGAKVTKDDKYDQEWGC